MRTVKSRLSSDCLDTTKTTTIHSTHRGSDQYINNALHLPSDLNSQ